MEDKNNANSAVIVAFQLGLQDHCNIAPADTQHDPCIRRSVLLDVLLQLMKEPTFTVLRTQEQLGYVAAALVMASSTWIVPGPINSTAGVGDDVLSLVVLVQGMVDIQTVHPFRAAVPCFRGVRSLRPGLALLQVPFMTLRTWTTASQRSCNLLISS